MNKYNWFGVICLFLWAISTLFWPRDINVGMAIGYFWGGLGGFLITSGFICMSLGGSPLE